MTCKTLFLLLPTLLGPVGLHAGRPQVCVARYDSGRVAALSLTFDDGLLEHYTVIFPLLRRLGLRATFGLIGSRVGGVTSGKYKNVPCLSWEQAREMALGGQEITSHGYAHLNVTRLSPAELRREVQHNDTLIWQHTGQLPRTYLYPGNRKSDTATAFCSRGRTCTRTSQVSLGGKRTPEWFGGYLCQLMASHGWGITMTHGIAMGYDHFDQPRYFTRMLELAAARQDSLWIAPLRDVGAYVQERDHARLRVRQRRGRLVIRVRTGLDPAVFHHPLTLLVDGRPYRVEMGKRGGRLEIELGK